MLHFNVGILDHQGLALALKQWTALIDYMSNKSLDYFGERYDFHFVAATYDGTKEAVMVSNVKIMRWLSEAWLEACLVDLHDFLLKTFGVEWSGEVPVYIVFYVRLVGLVVCLFARSSL